MKKPMSKKMMREEEMHGKMKRKGKGRKKSSRR
jgi:hypothetical protein